MSLKRFEHGTFLISTRQPRIIIRLLVKHNEKIVSLPKQGDDMREQIIPYPDLQSMKQVD